MYFYFFNDVYFVIVLVINWWKNKETNSIFKNLNKNIRVYSNGLIWSISLI